MLQNTMLTRFLRLGSLFLLFLFIACNTERIDYIIWADWIYINKTEHIIEVKDFNGFKLSPDSSFTYKMETGGSKHAEPNDYLSPYGAGIKIIVNDKEHTLQKNEGITNIANYEAEKVERNYYRFTYVFNEDTIPKDSE